MTAAPAAAVPQLNSSLRPIVMRPVISTASIPIARPAANAVTPLLERVKTRPAPATIPDSSANFDLERAEFIRAYAEEAAKNVAFINGWPKVVVLRTELQFCEMPIPEESAPW